jgi:hypothetical protein
MYFIKKLPQYLENKIFYFLENPQATLFKKYKKTLIYINNNRKWFDYDFYMTRKYINVPPHKRHSPYHYYRDLTYNEFYSARGYQKRLIEYNKKFKYY